MTGYAFHPEAGIDIVEIWEYIAADSLEATDRVIGDIHQSLEALVPFPHRGHRRPDPPGGRCALFSCVLPDCLRSREEAVSGLRPYARPPQPTRHGRDPPGPGSQRKVRDCALARAG